MVARVLFLVLTCRGNAITPPVPGDPCGRPDSLGPQIGILSASCYSLKPTV